MIPGTIGTVMPAARARRSKSKKAAFEKKRFVIRTLAPA
jgi:hypothetical protein